MLKHAFKCAFKTKYIKNLSEIDSLKEVCPKYIDLARRNGPRMNLKELYSARIAYQKNSFASNKKPKILLGGILTFLGLQKPEQQEPELILTIKKGILLIKRKQYKKAEEMLHSALMLAQDEKDEDGITYVQDVLANLAFQTRQYEKAEKLFVSVMQRLLAKGEKQDSNKIIEISLKLSKIFEDQKDYKKAELGYKYCIETMDKKLGEDDQDTLALWGMSMDWYARFLLETNRKSEALTCFKKAYEMCVRVNGMEHEQTVILLNDLGTVSTLVGDNESALNYLEQAKKIGEKFPEMKDLPAIHVNLGLLYLLRQMYKESKLACQEGMKMAKSQEDEVAFLEAKLCLDKIKNALQESKISNQTKQSQLLVN